MKTLAASLLFPLLFAAVPSARADRACEDRCQRDWPRPYFHAVPRKACQAKCWAQDRARSLVAAGSRTVEAIRSAGGAVVTRAKEVGEKVAARAKEVGKKVAAQARKLARGAWDAARKCIADGLGGCVKTIVTAAGNIARGLWDKAKRCFADGLGGCLEKVARSAAELACKGVGTFWDAARQCCRKKGAVRCVKDAVKGVVQKGIAWLCRKGMPKLVPALNQAAARLLNKAGAALKGYTLSLRGSEIGALACALKARAGHAISDLSRKLGDPYLTISDIRIGGVAERSRLVAPLEATATLSVPGQKGALSLRLAGSVDAQIDTSCNFEGPLATFGAYVDRVHTRSIPQWLTDRAVGNFVNPNLGCMTFCPPVLKPAGMDLKLDYCTVIDACLKSRCAAPVLNTIIRQIFPVSMALAPMLPDKPALAAVRREISGWSLTVGGVRFRANARDPYRPSITASVAIGPAGRPKFNVQATGTLALETYCRPDGRSMVKVTPSLSLKLGDVPRWMQEITLPNVANTLIAEALGKPGGPPGRFAISYPGFLSGRKSQPRPPADLGPGLIQRIQSSWEGLKMAVRTALAGKFKGNRAACDSIAKPRASERRGGACVLCMQTPRRDSAPTRATARASGTGVPSDVAHIAGSRVNFRARPSRKSQVLAVLKRCTELRVLQRNLPGTANFWVKVSVGKRTGYVATQYVARGPAMCGRSSTAR